MPAPTPVHAAEATVDLDAIAHNTALLAGSTRAALMAVVKADAFGHGAEAVARTALEHGATWLGVTSCAEALRLRGAGITAPVLSWLHPPDADFGPAVEADVDLSAGSVDALAGIAAGARRAGVPAQVHLKVDTGLGRNGATEADWPRLVSFARYLEKQGVVRVRGVWSHLAGGDDPDAVRRQVERFERAVACARDAGLDPPLRHLANSAALPLPESHHDLVRVGIGLYGVEPVEGFTFGLRAALTLRARVVLVKQVPAGTGVSYGHEYVTGRPSTLALVPLGYADGVPRLAGNRGEVWIAGRRYPVAGRVAMDQFVVDLGGDTARAGDEVVLFGTGDRGEPTVTDWARWALTIPHEILTGIGCRVPRRHLRGAGRMVREVSAA